VPAPVRIIVRRGDDHVTDLRGDFGIVACGEGLEVNPHTGEPLSAPPSIALRCDSVAELSWCLATIIASVQHVAPGAVEAAIVMSAIIRPDDGEIQRLPPKRGRG